jgi:predicted transcriptional regulator
MAIFELAPAIKSSTKIVKAQTNKAVLRLVPEIKNGEVASNRTFVIFLATIFTASLLSLLVINTALARDAFVISQLKEQAILITDQREAILQEVAAKSSPDKLAQRASELGMVASSNPRFLDMSVGK